MARANSGEPLILTVALETLIGRTVWTLDDRRLGRLEDGRIAFVGDDWVIGEWIIGPAGLLERFGVSARLLIGVHPGAGYVARWNQLNVDDPQRPRLTCPVSELSVPS